MGSIHPQGFILSLGTGGGAANHLSGLCPSLHSFPLSNSLSATFGLMSSSAFYFSVPLCFLVGIFHIRCFFLSLPGFLLFFMSLCLYFSIFVSSDFSLTLTLGAFVSVFTYSYLVYVSSCLPLSVSLSAFVCVSLCVSLSLLIFSIKTQSHSKYYPRSHAFSFMLT